jgi:sirohydrochlorin ferrochelatase
LIVVLSISGAAAAETAKPDSFGLLIMAHGGSTEWNQSVLDAVEQLKAPYPVAVAFGMAAACSIQKEVRSLEEQGVRKVGVVRLFISGESWYERTEQILGLRDGAPPAAETAAACEGSHPANHHSMALFRIDSKASFTLSKQGLSEAPEIGAIVAERAGARSRDPKNEDVLVLAHGPGDDEENRRWLAHMDARAAEVRKSRLYHNVSVMTLREDWPDKRKLAEEQIRSFVTRSTSQGRRVIVVPFRLSGFGPYAEVLTGLDYQADRSGFLPHANVTRWIARQAEELRAGSFRTSNPGRPN